MLKLRNPIFQKIGFLDYYKTKELMTIFISRKIAENSPFFSSLKEKNISINGFSLLKFTAIPFNKIPETDWIFFYSQNAVQFFFEAIKTQNIPIPNVKWGAIGKLSAYEIEKHIQQIDFIGNGNPSETAENFKHKAQNCRVLFPCAWYSRHSIQVALQNDIEGISLPIYKNEIIENIPKLKEDLLVFTSPMNVEAYFSKFTLANHQSTLAIGQTTAETLRKMTGKEPLIAQETSENSLAETVMLFFHN
jgi:uroporphyrinogen-III synthase